ncbi:S41 family peptidase [Metallumcola ferriviriculae]|uniref:S41 family peptidase n=1 Tax=Metallumcola ferriviriculae TaxID=3039180 RepID=A0AAU0UP15_9FIRM|nr:S41 family peptidase [Desulfitibacteraceae bacterium MK1]
MIRRSIPRILTTVIILLLLITGVFGYVIATDFMHLGRMLKVIGFIETQAMDPVPIVDLVDGALAGMVDSLEDPYSVYMEPKVYKDLSAHIKGSYGGVGLLITMKDKQLVVLSPFKGTPAHKAGIKAEDIITKIDGKETTGMTLDDAAELMKGKPGTEVVLTVSREGTEPKDYPIVREEIDLPTVTGEMLKTAEVDGIGYINISMFSDTTGKDLNKTLTDLQSKGLKAVVLDLRNNPGGALNAAVDVAEAFVPKGPIVHIVGREGTNVYEADSEYLNLPLVVLVNKGSASASEIVSGAIKDTGTGTIVGTTTFGKGLVQTVYPLGKGAAVKLTTAKYLTPDKRDINEKGIVPDVIVELDAETEQEALLTAPNLEKDSQLQKAVEILAGKLK